MGFFDSIGDALTSGDFLASAFSTLANTGLGLLQTDIKQDEAELARQDAMQQQLMELKLEKLKALYGSKGGGGGGSGSQLTTAQKLSAIQNQADTKIDAINNLINATQRGILGGR